MSLQLFDVILFYFQIIETVSQSQRDYLKDSDLDLELKASSEKIKQISAAWALPHHIHPNRKSGGGIQDYLDQKTLQHLEDLKIIDPPTQDVSSDSILQNIKDYSQAIPGELGRETASGPDYLEISKRVRTFPLLFFFNVFFGFCPIMGGNIIIGVCHVLKNIIICRVFTSYITGCD